MCKGLDILHSKEDCMTLKKMCFYLMGYATVLSVLGLLQLGHNYVAAYPTLTMIVLAAMLIAFLVALYDNPESRAEVIQFFRNLYHKLRARWKLRA